MTEKELCILFEEYYREWEIYKEVPCSGGRLDMYARKGPLWVAVEVKMRLSTLLITQAQRHRGHANYTHIAIPHSKGNGPGVEICKTLGIGVYEYRSDYPHVPGWYLLHQAEYRRAIKPYRVLDRMKHAVAGVQHSTESEFKITVYKICEQLKRVGGEASLKGFFKANHFHYRHERSALQAIRKLCEMGAIKEFTIENGFLKLTKK